MANTKGVYKMTKERQQAFRDSYAKMTPKQRRELSKGLVEANTAANTATNNIGTRKKGKV